MLTLTAVIRRDEDMYVAECPEVGTASQGKTIEEAVKNLKEATELYLEEFPLKITGTVVPMHDELKPGTLRSVQKLAKVDPGEFAEYL